MIGSSSTIVGTEKCGIRYPIPERSGEAITAYNATGSALAKGDVVMLTYSNTSGRELSAATPATSTFPITTAVALAAVSAGSIGKFQITGKASVKCGDGTNAIAAGKFLEVLNGKKYAEEDGASRTTVSLGVLVDAVSAGESAALKNVILIGEQHTIAAS